MADYITITPKGALACCAGSNEEESEGRVIMKLEIQTAFDWFCLCELETDGCFAPDETQEEWEYIFTQLFAEAWLN